MRFAYFSGAGSAVKSTGGERGVKVDMGGVRFDFGTVRVLYNLAGYGIGHIWDSYGWQTC